MSDLFYSQVNQQLQNELNARANAGVRRNTADLAHLLEKIGNVELIAYKGDNPTNDNRIPAAEFGYLGGNTTRSKDYLPPGFLSGTSSTDVLKTKPFVNSVSFDLKDQTRGYINKGEVKIFIPDPGRDLNAIEQIYCKPGRNVQITIFYPDSAILTTDKLSPSDLVDYSNLLKIYPDVNENEVQKLSKVTFNGKISTFSWSYDVNGSIEVSFEVLGTTGTYINVSTYISENISNKNNENKNSDSRNTNNVGNFYGDILTDVTKKIRETLQLDADKNLPLQPIEIKYDPDREDQNILYGPLYQGQPFDIFISLGLFTRYVNEFILPKIRSSNETEDNQSINIPNIICSDEFCKSIYYSELVSAAPKSILFWSGINADNKFNVYGEGPSQKIMYDSVTATTKGLLDNWKTADPLNESNIIDKGLVLRPARIYINIRLIDKFITEQTEKDKDVTIKSLFNMISTAIDDASGDAFRMRLTQHPQQAGLLMYYDTNFYDPSSSVQEFTLPVFAKNGGRTIVKDITITTKVPESIKQLIYGLQSGKTTTQKMALSSAYIYATPEVQETLREDHAKNHEDAVNSLNEAKQGVAKQPDGELTFSTLKTALRNYITYYDPDLEKTLNNTKPVYPLEISLTIHGVNGFKYGDVLNIQGIPDRYTQSFVFMVTGVSNKLTSNGEWTTTLTLLARLRL